MSGNLSPELLAEIKRVAQEHAARAPRFTAEHIRKLRELMGLDHPRDDTKRGAA